MLLGSFCFGVVAWGFSLGVAGSRSLDWALACRCFGLGDHIGDVAFGALARGLDLGGFGLGALAGSPAWEGVFWGWWAGGSDWGVRALIDWDIGRASGSWEGESRSEDRGRPQC